MSDPIRRFSPAGLHPTSGYHHVTIVAAGRQAQLAGQCPVDEHDRLVGAGDLNAQIDQVIANARIALAAAGAAPEQVIRSVIYVVSSDSGVLARAWDRFAESTLGPAFTSASTILGVTCLGYRGQLVELDLTAALER